MNLRVCLGSDNLSKVAEISTQFLTLISNPQTEIVLDACIIISPDRRNNIKAPADRRHLLKANFDQYKTNFLDLLFSYFSNISIHEAVNDKEIVDDEARRFTDEQLQKGKLKILKDSDLTTTQMVVRNAVESLISQSTNYNISRDNKDDRGEVKTLSYVAAVGSFYFSSRDDNALELLNTFSTKTNTLSNINPIRFFELIFFLNHLNKKDYYKYLYKLCYYMTEEEKKYNPNWGEFISKCPQIT